MPRRICILYGPKCSDGGSAAPGPSRCRAHGGGPWARVDPSAKKHYGAAWQETRRRVLAQSPMCEQGCGRRATDVDHIVALADGGTDGRENLRALCAPRHKQHTR